MMFWIALLLLCVAAVEDLIPMSVLYGSSANEGFGDHVAMSSDGMYAAAASWRSGMHVYVRSGSTYGMTWTEQHALTECPATSAITVALSGNGEYLMCGDSDFETYTGRAFVFHRSGSTWSQMAVLEASDQRTFAYFGFAISMSDDASYVVVGAYGAGAVYVFTRSGSNFTEETILTDGQIQSFGYSAAISGQYGDYVVASCRNDYSASTSIVHREGSRWSHQAYVSGTCFHTISALGDYVVTANGDRSDLKELFIYKRSGSTWTQQEHITTATGTEVSSFGHYAHINRAGDWVLVGAAYGGSYSDGVMGSACLYVRSGGVWSLLGRWSSPSPQPNDAYGTSFATGSGYVFIGAPVSRDSGGAYVYKMECPDGYYGDICKSQCACSGHLECFSFRMGGCKCPGGFVQGGLCSECRTGYYGSHCSWCGCGSHGTCDDGISGAGCMCDLGFNGTSCEMCAYGYYGPQCTECTCGSHGTCDDGSTGSGICTCDLGFSGTSCELCSSGYYGDECTECTCGLHGTCDDGKSGSGCVCDLGFNGTSCELCAHGYYGSECTECTCGLHGTCDDGMSGSGCVCDLGFNGTWCELCSSGYYGDECTECTCGLHGTCNDGRSGSGHCQCDAGFNGSSCELCASGYFGSECTECACGLHGTCHDGRTGSGICTCDSGFNGTSCELCAHSYYGSECTECTCGLHGTCDDGMSGSGCVCDLGFNGTSCELCSSGYYGDECTKCTCGLHGTCNDGRAGSGHCQCDAGFNGTSCELCSYGYYGSECTECTCGLHGSCDDGITGSGICTCDSSFNGTSCELCSYGYYGPECTQCTCGSHGTCDDGRTGSGHCQCDVGYNSTSCELCAHGYYGDECTECTCGSHGTCDDGKTGSGICTCDISFNGTSCQLCSYGYFGPECAECTCGSHGTCDDGRTGSGICTCDVGFYGTSCELCASGYFGPDCTECTCGLHGTCDDGKSGIGCVCDIGFNGTSCELCAYDYYGPECTKCTCTLHGTCDDGKSGSGICACDLGYDGTLCNVCASGYGDTAGACVECAVRQVTRDNVCVCSAGTISVETDVCLPCSKPWRCPGGGNCTDSLFDPSSRCSTCIDNYFPRRDTCLECPFIPWQILAILLFIVAAIYFLYKFTTNEKVSTTIKIVINFLQITSITFTLRLTWPDFVYSIADYVSSLTLNFHLITPECLMRNVHFWKFLFTAFFLPVVCVVIFILIKLKQRFLAKVDISSRSYHRLGSPLLESAKHANTIPKTKEQIRMLFRLIVMLVSIMVVPISKQLMVPLICKKLSDGTYVLAADLEYACWTPYHYTMIVISVVAIPIVLTVFIVAWKRLRKFATMERLHYDTYVRFGSVLDAHLPDRVWFEVVTSARKCLLSVAAIIFVTDSAVLAVILAAISFVYLLAVIFYQPYVPCLRNILCFKNVSIFNAYETIGTITVIVTQILSLYGALVSRGDGVSRTIAIVVLVLNGFVLVLMLLKLREKVGHGKEDLDLLEYHLDRMQASLYSNDPMSYLQHKIAADRVRMRMDGKLSDQSAVLMTTMDVIALEEVATAKKVVAVPKPLPERVVRKMCATVDSFLNTHARFMAVFAASRDYPGVMALHEEVPSLIKSQACFLLTEVNNLVSEVITTESCFNLSRVAATSQLLTHRDELLQLTWDSTDSRPIGHHVPLSFDMTEREEEIGRVRYEFARLWEEEEFAEAAKLQKSLRNIFDSDVANLQCVFRAAFSTGDSLQCVECVEMIADITRQVEYMFGESPDDSKK